MFKKLLIIFLIIGVTGSMANAQVTSGTTCVLGWDANTEEYLTGYNVYRSPGTGPPYIEIDFVTCGPNDATCCEYVNPGLTEGVTYFYVISAEDSYNQKSGYSNEVFYTPPITPPPMPVNPKGLKLK